jgi:hypothetical protein
MEPSETMDMLTVLTWAYVAIAVSAIVLTIRERMQERRHSLRSALAGLVACILWPVTAAGVAVAVAIDARSTARR